MRRHPVQAYLLVAATLQASAMAGVWVGLRVSSPLWVWLSAINLVTALLFAYDKLIAGGRRTRVPEVALLVLSALGGSPAALVTMTTLRHKTIKEPFRRRFFLVVIVQALFAAALAIALVRPDLVRGLF